jgi:hypothetical protein
MEGDDGLGMRILWSWYWIVNGKREGKGRKAWCLESWYTPVLLDFDILSSNSNYE